MKHISSRAHSTCARLFAVLAAFAAADRSQAQNAFTTPTQLPSVVTTATRTAAEPQTIGSNVEVFS
ncbi:MAG: hypothetical protein ABIZ49_04305, partial [Opitutaceae bacterium]